MFFKTHHFTKTKRHNDVQKDTMMKKDTMNVKTQRAEKSNFYITFLYNNMVLILKIKKRSFLWCDFFKKIMSYVKVMNVLKT